MADGIAYFLHCPEASAVCFLAGSDVLVVDDFVGIDKFVFAFGVELIHLHQFATLGIDAQFLACLSQESGVDVLAEVHVPAYGRVPLAGLYVLPHGALLQVEFAFLIEDMQVHHGMQKHGTIVAFGACGFSNDIAGGVNEGEKFPSPSRPSPRGPTPSPSTREGSMMYCRCGPELVVTTPLPCGGVGGGSF